MISLTLASAACSRQSEDGTATAGDASASAKGDEVTVTGCVTSAPDRNAFVLTASRDALASSALRSNTGEVPTYTYELVGTTDLQAHVARQVEVKGRLDDDRKDVDVDTKDKVELPPTRTGDNAAVTPAIETKSEVELKVRRLHVTSVTPTGQPCQTTR
jgi:hypothetical protein